MNAKNNSTSEEDTVLIKKYANRRLYNTQTSSYVTLDDLAELVRSGGQFKVVDAKTNEEMTRQVLVQIILDQEMAGAEMIPIELLSLVVRYCNTDMHQNLSKYLAHSTKAFFEQNEKMYKNFGGLGDWEALQRQQSEWIKKTFEMMSPLNKNSS